MVQNTWVIDLKRTIAILMFLPGMIGVVSVDAQVLQRDEEGTYIIRYPDNSWRAFLPRDSFLYRNLIEDYLERKPANVQVERSTKNIGVEDEIELAPTNVSERDSFISIEDIQLRQQLEDQNQTPKVDAENASNKAILKEAIEEVRQEPASQPQPRDRYFDHPSSSTVEPVKPMQVFHYNQYNFPAVEGRDFIKYPPTARCHTELIIDPKTKAKTYLLPMDVLLSYTPDKLKLKLNEDAYITFVGQLWKMDSDYFFRLHVDINDKQARAAFAGLPLNAAMELQLINGNVVHLKNQVAAEFVQVDGAKHQLEALYQLERDDIKQLERSELDRMRVHWGAGYEDYELYNLLFFQKQIACLKKM